MEPVLYQRVSHQTVIKLAHVANNVYLLVHILSLLSVFLITILRAVKMLQVHHHLHVLRIVLKAINANVHAHLLMLLKKVGFLVAQNVIHVVVQVHAVQVHVVQIAIKTIVKTVVQNVPIHVVVQVHAVQVMQNVVVLVVAVVVVAVVVAVVLELRKLQFLDKYKYCSFFLF